VTSFLAAAFFLETFFLTVVDFFTGFLGAREGFLEDFFLVAIF
jgi:hypothetical protein